jgi:hypothetical protein
MKSTEVWIGRIDVKPRPGNEALGSAKGAIVNVVALASDDGSYIEAVKTAMEEYEFDVVRCEDIAQLNDWRKENKVHRELERLADGLTLEFPIQFDEFQSYLDDDA